MKEPVDHIIRPILPWRDGTAAITECGYDAMQVRAITRHEFFQRFKDMGQQRCALMTCMTCSDTSRRWATWAEDPRQALNREIVWERGEWTRSRTDRGDLLKREFLAIEELIEAHRDEFAAMLEARTQRQEWLAKKAAHRQAKPEPRKPQPPRGGL